MVLIGLFLLTACTSKNTTLPTKTPIRMENNFSFIYQYTDCGEVPLDALYTSSGVLIHTSLDENDSVTIPFHLTSEEMRVIFDKLVEIDYFNYPSDFTIPSGYVAVTAVPASSYLISVINGDQSHVVQWIGGSAASTDYPKAIQLMELFILIQDIIYGYSEYQQIPPPTAVCV